MTERKYTETEDLCELLPWYVNHTLDDAESSAVERHLRDCKTCAEDLQMLRAVRGSARNESITVLAPKPDAEQFLANLKQRGSRLPLPTSAWIAVAAAASIAALAVIFSWVQTDDATATPAQFTTATNAGSDKTFDYVILVSFAEDIDPQTRSQALGALAPESIAGPDSVGNYRLVIRLPARSMDELQDFTRGIESDSLISSAKIIAVQLPIETH